MGCATIQIMSGYANSSVVDHEPETVAFDNLSPTARKTFTLYNRQGLHLRPATLLARELQSYDCRVTVQCLDAAVNALSIIGLMTLAAGYGSRLTFTVTGPDAERAMEAVASLFANNFQAAY